VKPWSVYVLRCAGGTFYTGITNDLGRRLQAHREGRGAKYTRGRLPLELVHVEEAPSRGAAARREAQIKRLRRGGKLLLIAAGSAGARPAQPAPAPRRPGRA
jgi:putative endonuclease